MVILGLGIRVLEVLNDTTFLCSSWWTLAVKTLSGWGRFWWRSE